MPSLTVGDLKKKIDECNLSDNDKVVIVTGTAVVDNISLQVEKAWTTSSRTKALMLYAGCAVSPVTCEHCCYYSPFASGRGDNVKEWDGSCNNRCIYVNHQWSCPYWAKRSSERKR